ncbi:hypothetical protein CF128_10490 [Aeromonas veronii]|nr:hypothetical protein CF128_10490 [Aeromonas veronii]TNJ15507.1 hypothetical protein CF113_12370 [Aeromonas veronii]
MHRQFKAFTLNDAHKKNTPTRTSSGQLFSHIQLREIKGLKDRTSYLCTLRRQLYSKAAESESNLCNLVSQLTD